MEESLDLTVAERGRCPLFSQFAESLVECFDRRCDLSTDRGRECGRLAPETIIDLPHDRMEGGGDSTELWLEKSRRGVIRTLRRDEDE